MFYWWKKRATLHESFHIFILFVFHFHFDFYIGEEGKKSMMDHLQRKWEILLHWLYIGDCTCFEIINLSNRSVRAFESKVPPMVACPLSSTFGGIYDPITSKFVA